MRKEREDTVVTEVVIPLLGITVENGIILEWLKQEGDPVEKGESLFIVEAEKVTTEVESPASGVLGKILVPVGKEMPVLTVVGLITAPGEAIPEEYLSGAVDGDAPEAEEPVAAEKTQVAASPVPDKRVPEGPLKIVPAARQLAKEKGIVIETLTGTGPEGVILYSDVEASLARPQAPAVKASPLARKLADKEGVPIAGIQGSGVRGRIMTADVKASVAAAAAPGLGKVIPMDSMRRVIARRMSESAFTAPHIYFFSDIPMDPVLNFRKSILTDFESAFGLRISINDLLIKAVALNIADFPIMNARIVENDIHILPDINVCLAIALDDGLIVPSLENSDQCGLAEIARQRTDLIQRARTGNLAMEEMERGTFTISSLAQYDINYFTAIINPPQSGILSVGKTREELYLDDGEVKARKIATFGLAVDHRIIDGVIAADFLQHLKKKLEKPQFTFLHH